MNTKEANGAVETYKHIDTVREYINSFVEELIKRGENHDATKLESPELEIFGEFGGNLAKLEYGSKEYNDNLEKVRPAIEHHYSKNRHHPEHFPNGINGMTLVDLIELLSDWRAATERNANGNIRKSIEINAKRYKISPQLREILENTVREMFQE